MLERMIEFLTNDAGRNLFTSLAAIFTIVAGLYAFSRWVIRKAQRRSMTEPTAATPTWKRVTASILDFIMAFFAFGYLVAAATGILNQPSGFSLDGWPALLMFVLIGVYFYVGRCVAGGTLWDRFFGIGRPQPK